MKYFYIWRSTVGIPYRGECLMVVSVIRQLRSSNGKERIKGGEDPS